MKRLLSVVFLFLALQLLATDVQAQEYIKPEDAYKHIGETQTVCGMVASTFYAIRSRGQPTFLNLERPYPNQIFTIVIWGSDRDKFKNPPEIFFKDKRVCVTGTITSYRGKPQITVNNPSQISIRSPSSLLRSKDFYFCTRIVDGDTIIVKMDSREEIVRLIGVDTPEIVHPEKPVEYFGQEASGFTKRLVEGKRVKLEYDWQGRDDYGRLLAYVYLEDGTFLNAEIIKQGYEDKGSGLEISVLIFPRI